MHTVETIEYKGCKICIHQDETPENPFEAWDCEPALLTYYGGRHGFLKSYNNAPESWWDVLRLLPQTCFERGKRMELIKQLNCTLKEFAEEERRMGTIDAVVEFLTSQCGATPSGWGDAVAWFEMAEWVLNWGGITAIYQQSTGYSQGDCTLCLAIATPKWIEMTGAPQESHKRQMEGAIELYGFWAWGNVYGFTCEDENGDDLEEIGASVWGFYGTDYEKSGLMEAAKEAIDSHLDEQAKIAEQLELAFSF